MAEATDMAFLEAIKTPLDNLRNSLGSRVLIKLRSGVSLHGLLHAYDQHLNMCLGNVDEVEAKTNNRRHIGMMYLRGDGVVMVTREESDDIA
jgi:small nuclear ribonucleoprotein (snRNP)-like protein